MTDADNRSAILTAMMVGTERRHFDRSAVVDPAQNLIQQLAIEDVEGALLALAGTHALQQLSGRIPTRESALKRQIVATDDVKPCTANQREALFAVTDGTHAYYRAEWLRLAGAANIRIPDAYLPKLLAIGIQNERRRPRIIHQVGPRGRWLAQFNPDWRYASVAPDDVAGWERLWLTGTEKERLTALMMVRRIRPKTARTWLAAAYDSETDRFRGRAVSKLVDGLSIDDEPFLETVLDDKAAKPRRSAAELLALLPASRLSQNIQDRLTPLFTWNWRKQMAVEWPAPIDDELQRDGIRLTTARNKLSSQAWQLRHMVGMCPLSFWTTVWNHSPTDWIKFAVGSQWEQALILGWTKAAHAERNVDWAEAILSGVWADWLSKDLVTRLVVHLPAAHRDRLALKVLAMPRMGTPFAQREAFARVLQRSTHQWGPELSRAVLKELTIYFRMSKQGHPQLRATVTGLAPIPRRLPPAMLPEVERTLGPLSKDPKIPASTRRTIDNLIDTLRIRHRLHATFASPSN